MEYEVPLESEIHLKSTILETSLVKVTLHWEGLSHVLLTITSQGIIKYITLLTPSSNKPHLSWSGFTRSEYQEVHAYGLQLKKSYPGKELFSVLSVKKMEIPENCFDGTTRDMEVKCIESTYVTRKQMIDDFSSQRDFQIETKPETSLSFALDLQYPFEHPVLGLFVILCKRTNEEHLMLATDLESKKITLEDVFQSRSDYIIRGSILENKMKSFERNKEIFPTDQWTSVQLSVKTCMSEEDLEKLIEKSNIYRLRFPCRKYPIKYFYRNKPPSYFSNIMEENDGIMVKYIKDNNGDPYSAINKRINGLFFSATLEPDTGRPWQRSHFGSRRLFIPAEELVSSQTRMYFADFYCNRSAHYVTVVLTKPDSVEDKFCEGRLIKLDLKNNPFFTVQETGFQKIFTLTSGDRFRVEFLYTENVDIQGLMDKCGEHKVYFENVVSLGESRIDGIPKNPFCSHCNLHSVESMF